MFRKKLTAAQKSDKLSQRKATKIHHKIEDLKTEHIFSEWMAKGKNHRDWVKHKVIFFDEDNEFKVMLIEKYNEMELKKVIDQKKVDQKFLEDMDSIQNSLELFDIIENKDAENDCNMCFNILTESCLLPCCHRFCYQCMRENPGYHSECPICRSLVPPFFKLHYYHHNVEKSF